MAILDAASAREDLDAAVFYRVLSRPHRGERGESEAAEVSQLHFEVIVVVGFSSSPLRRSGTRAHETHTHRGRCTGA